MPDTNQEVIIDLAKSPDIADEVAGMQPGDEVCLHGPIKSLDSQTLVVTVQQLSIPKDDGDGADTENAADDTSEGGGNEGSGDVQAPSQTGGLTGEDAQV